MQMTRRAMRRIVVTFLALAIGVYVLLAFPFPGEAAPVDPATNNVSYWCQDDGGYGGVKYEPVDDPFIVPVPPEGTAWELLVLKAGTTNETVVNPIPGQSYSHSEHDNSHVILCWEPVIVTTTTTLPPTTTTTLPPTTTTTVAPTTTEPATTTTVEATTTTSGEGGVTGSTVVESTTTTTLAVTTTLAETTTPETPAVITTTDTLPVTGLNTSDIGWIALGMILIGLAALGGAAWYGKRQEA